MLPISHLGDASKSFAAGHAGNDDAPLARAARVIGPRLEEIIRDFHAKIAQG